MLKLFKIAKTTPIYCSLIKSTKLTHFHIPQINRSFCTSDHKNSELNLKEINNQNDIEDESLNYDFFDAKYIYNTTNDFSKFVNQMKCKGCGINLQIENQEKIGYIPAKKFFDHINKKEDTNKNTNSELNQTNETSKINEFEKVYDKSTLKRLSKLKNSNNILICERCYKLTNYLNFEDLNKENKNDKSQEKVDNYTSLVKKINPQRLIHQIMTRISNKAHVFYVCVSLYYNINS